MATTAADASALTLAAGVRARAWVHAPRRYGGLCSSLAFRSLTVRSATLRGCSA